MKRSLLFLIGIALLLSPARGSAQVPEPLSPAVAAVVQRAQKAIRAANGQGGLVTFFDGDIVSWLVIGFSAIVAPVDTQQAVIRQEESLARQTSCLRYDRWVIEETMREAQELLAREQTRKNIFAISRLQDAYRFLAREHAALLQGALNPGIRDRQWQTPLLDEDLSELAVGPEREEEELCFYHSDYGPPGKAGYGCDVGVMSEILARLPEDAVGLRSAIEAERDALDLAAERVRTDAQPEPQSGCVERDEVKEGILLRATRGAFSLEDNPDALFLFRELRTREDENSSLPAEDLSMTGDRWLMDMIELDPLQKLKSFSAQQAALESVTFAATADPGLSLVSEFSDLRAAISRLIRLGNTRENGLRRFVGNFASFLARSCTDRPCGARLGLIQMLVSTDECFPYGNGQYLTASPDDPQWKRCLCKASPEAEACGEE